MSIKYYNLAKDEELPEEFCAVRNVNGEPSEYTWYERMSDFERELWVLFNQSDWFAGSEYRKLQAENAKLREERDYYKALWEHATVTDCELRRVRAAWKEDREKNDKLRESLERATGIIADITKRNRDRFPLRRRNFTKAERDQWADRVLSGEIGTFEAARMAGVTPQTICKWKRERK